MAFSRQQEARSSKEGREGGSRRKVRRAAGSAERALNSIARGLAPGGGVPTGLHHSDHAQCHRRILLLPVALSAPFRPWWLAAAALCSAGVQAADPESAPTKATPRWEGAVGVSVLYSPTYLGSSDYRTRAVPGLFLRYGRFALTTASGFVTRSHDEVNRGVSADLVQRDNLRVTLSARLDGGRDPDSDDFLRGLDRIRPTVRARLSALRRFDNGWRLGAALSPDVLGRDGGMLADASVGYEWLLMPQLRANAAVGITAADRRYMRSYFGVSAAESVRSGHAQYAPGAGLRDVGASFGLRADLGPHWVGYANAGVQRLLGPTLDSPLTRGRSGWSGSVGLAWRF
jgi:outer membrane protein